MVDPILFTCDGTNEHGSRCSKLLFVYRPPAVVRGELGDIEHKCRRCRHMNVFNLMSAIQEPDALGRVVRVEPVMRTNGTSPARAKLALAKR